MTTFETAIILALIGALAIGIVLPEIRARKRLGSERFNFAERRAGLADLLPYRRLVRPGVCKNTNGAYLAAWRIAGRDVGTIGDADIINTAYQTAATIGGLPPGTIVQVYARRVPFHEYDRGIGILHPVLRVLDELRAEFFLRGGKISTTQRTLAITWHPPAAGNERMRAAGSLGVDAQIRSENEILDEFEDICLRIDSALSGPLNAQRLVEFQERDSHGVLRCRSDLLRFIDTCVTGRDKPFNTPPAGVLLNALLATEARGGYDVKVGDDEVGCVEIKTFPDEIVPRILDRLTELQTPHLFAVRLVTQSVQQSREQLRGAAVDFKGAAGFNAGFVDPEALAASESAVAAYGTASGDYTRVGKVSIVVVVRGKTRAAVRKAQREVIGVLEDAGFRGFPRTAGAFDTWLSTLPSNAKNGTRKYPLSALTVAKLFPVHESSMGRRFAASETLPRTTPALTYALRPGNTLYRAHLNVADVFHGFGIGKTTSGKSVALQYLSMSFRSRFPLTGVTILDNGRSARPGCKMVDGEFYDLLGRQSPGFALFTDAGDPDGDRERLAIIAEMIALQRNGVPVTPEEHEALATANRTIASMPRADRSMSAFYELVQDPTNRLRPALADYTRLGSLGAVLDASEDTFQVGRYNVIDVAHIMGLPDKHMLPLLRVIVWKTLSQIREMKRSLGARGQELHWLISIDEAHKIMKTPYGATFIADLQKMGRRNNVGVWLWSNALSEFVNSPGRNDLLMNSPSRIYFGDSAATESDVETCKLYTNLQVPARGLSMIPKLPERSFLLHQPDANVLVELNLALDKDVLGIVGTARDNELVDRFEAQYPVAIHGPHAWKIAFLRHKGATAAADRLAAAVIESDDDREAEPEVRLEAIAR